MHECFWWSQPRTAEEVVVGHIVVDVAPTETPGGTSAEEYEAFCGEKMFSYWHQGYKDPEPRFGTLSDVREVGIPFCRTCAKRSNKLHGVDADVSDALTPQPSLFRNLSLLVHQAFSTVSIPSGFSERIRRSPNATHSTGHPEHSPTGFTLRNKLSIYDSPLTKIAFAPDGRSLAALEGWQYVHLWDVESGTLKHSHYWLEEAMGTSEIRWIHDFAWSPDSTRFVVCTDDTLLLCEPTTVPVRLTSYVDFGRSRIRRLAWSPDAKTIAMGDKYQNRVLLWDVATRSIRCTLSGHKGEIHSLGWSGDSRLLASCSQDRTIRVWHGETGKLYKTLTGHSRGVFTLSWSPADVTRLASASRDRTVRIWDVPSGRQRAVLKGHKRPINCVAFSSDGMCLASRAQDGIHLWDVNTEDVIATLSDGSNKYYHRIPLTFHPKAPVIASLHKRETEVRIWELHFHNSQRNQ